MEACRFVGACGAPGWSRISYGCAEAQTVLQAPRPPLPGNPSTATRMAAYRPDGSCPLPSPLTCRRYVMWGDITAQAAAEMRRPEVRSTPCTRAVSLLCPVERCRRRASRRLDGACGDCTRLCGSLSANERRLTGPRLTSACVFTTWQGPCQWPAPPACPTCPGPAPDSPPPPCPPGGRWRSTLRGSSSAPRPRATPRLGARCG